MLVCKMDQVLSGLFKLLRYISEGLFPLLVFFFFEFIDRMGCTLALLGTAEDPLDDDVALGPVFPLEPVHPTGSPAVEVGPTQKCLLGTEAFGWQQELFLMAGRQRWSLKLDLNYIPSLYIASQQLMTEANSYCRF